MKPLSFITDRYEDLRPTPGGMSMPGCGRGVLEEKT